MSSTCVQLLHLELRHALRTGALRQQPFRSQIALLKKTIQPFETSSISRVRIHTFRSRGYATIDPKNAGKRKLESVGKSNTRVQKSMSAPTVQSHLEASTDIKKQPVGERLLVYHCPRGKLFLLATFNFMSLLGFGMACLIVAPAYYYSDNPWWTAPAAIVCGAVPMMFFRYVSFPLVTWAHLPLPKLAQRSREAATNYAQNLPPNATLSLGYIRAGLFARRAQVSIGDLAPASSMTRPVTFKNVNPNVSSGSWWLRTPKEFYVSPKSGTGKASKNVVPGVWDIIYKRVTGGQQVTTWRM